MLVNTARVSASSPADPSAANNTSSASVTVAAPPSADLSISKSASPADPQPGTQITYSIALANAGPDGAQSVTLTDTLPAGTSFVSCSSTGGGACGGAGRNRTVTFSSLAAGASASITLVAQVDPATTPGTVLVNTAQVSAASPADPNAANNTSSASVTVVAPPSADLSVGKTASPTNPLPGANVTYTIAVSNPGPDAATSVTVTDTLPSTTSFVSCSSTGGGACGGSGRNRTVTFSSLASGASASITLVAQVNTGTTPGTVIVNTARVSAASPADPSAANNMSSASVTVAAPPSADLSVGKTASPTNPLPGANVTYTIAVSNAGPDPATSVTVTDTLSSTTSFVSCSSTGGGACGGAGRNRTVTFSSLASGASASITLVAEVDAGTTPGTVLVNTAQVSAASPADPGAANNTSSTSVTVAAPPSADLSVGKTAAPTNPQAGANVTYSITVSNTGPNAATSVTVTDTLPSTTSFVSCSSTGGGACGGSGRNRTVTFTSLAAGASATITLVAQVKSTASPGTVIVNTARVSAASPADPNAANNTSSASVTVAASGADLSISKTGVPTNPQPGAQITYSISVTNAGPNPAQSVSVTDTLPAGTSFVSCAATAGGSCGGSGKNRTVTFTSLAAGASASITLVAQVNSATAPGTVLVNTARVSASSPADPNTASNSSSASVTVASPNSRATKGEWAPPFTTPVIAIHAHLLPNGKVLLWSDNYTYIWDPASPGSFQRMALTSTELFCSGHSFLPDGRLLVSGGHIPPDKRAGPPDSNIFDYRTNKWTPGPPMNAGRWYPTNTTLPNGEVLVVSGTVSSDVYNDLPQVWTTSGQWRDLTGANRVLALYPFMFVAPNGKVFMAGPKQKTEYLDTSGTGRWTVVGNSKCCFRDYGSAVMYDEGKVLIVGGAGQDDAGPPPTNTAEVIDLDAATPAWRYTNPMAFRRRQLNATLLPDGKVLVTGGTSSPGPNTSAGSVFAAEIWDPESEQWTTLASMQVRRLYHSTALLLPDGRVLAAGGGRPSADGEPIDFDHLDGEIYSPPYLFAPDGTPAVRPTITSAPSSVHYGETFFVKTPDSNSIVKVNWIRLSSVTHSYNEDQRINRLPFSKVAGGLNVLAPANGKLAPPGYYMLFVLNGDGVPSVARIIQIQ